MIRKMRTKVRRFFVVNPCDRAEAVCDVIFHPDYDNLDVPLKWYKYYPYKFFQFLDRLNRRYDGVNDDKRLLIFLAILFGPFLFMRLIFFVSDLLIFDFLSYISFVLSGLFRISYFRSFWK